MRAWALTEMEPEKLSLKLYARDAGGLTAKDFINTFHRWIQEKRLDELVIDVTDYSHVHHGPGVLLVCHDAHYAMDEAEGRLGLYHARKRVASGTLRERIELTFTRALRAARHLEQEPALEGRISFRTDEMRFALEDRLHAPNDKKTLELVMPELSAVVEKIWGKEPVVENRARPKECFTVDVRVTVAPELGALVARI